MLPTDFEHINKRENIHSVLNGTVYVLDVAKCRWLQKNRAHKYINQPARVTHMTGSLGPFSIVPQSCLM